MKRSLLLACISFLVLSSPFYLNAGVIFSDNFDSGAFGANWVSTHLVTISSNRASSGTYSAKFEFAPTDSWAELRFDLRTLYPEVWINYKLFIPSDYAPVKYTGGNNNKLFRLWGADYNNFEKIGASMWGQTSANRQLIGDWNSTGGGTGPSGAEALNFITSSDLNKWMDIKIRVKASTSTQMGTLQIWKNGVLIINNNGTVNSYKAGEPHAYRYGYLLGWAASDFPHTTYLYIDDVVFGTAEADIKGDTVTSPAIPATPGGLRHLQ